MKEDNNILEGNRLIAEFMGFKRFEDSREGSMRYKHWRIDPFGSFDDEGLKYHSSWDWLMLVVEKIEELRKPRTFPVYIFCNHCRIGECKPVSHRESKITATWQAVVQFIEWYNSQQKIKS